MKYVDEFRDTEVARRLVDAIRSQATRPWTLMEVCGGQTHNLLRFGVDAALSDCVELIHGPGCPVCVTPVEAIDGAQAIARQPGVTLASFGDMLRVPGSQRSLQQVRAAGGQVAVIYSPLDAVALARSQPRRQIVLFAVGFETTAPATALAVQQAAALQLDNFSVLSAHVRVLPAMELIAADPGQRVAAFLAAGHVCTITGYSAYHAFVDRFQLPVVVTGFELIDLLEGILAAVRQLESGTPRVENAYRRSVRESGNAAARQIVDEVYEVADAPWRGFGVVPGGGLTLRPSYRAFDARTRFPLERSAAEEDCECRAADVLAGRIKPSQCPLFGSGCQPDHPRGAPMVSSEGACAAYYRFRLNALQSE